MTQEDPALLRAKLTLETARLAWHELQRPFAAGTLLRVIPELDLIEVAAALAEDRIEQVRAWLDSGHLARVSDLEAERWHATDAWLWAVIVRPWIVLQDKSAPADRADAPSGRTP